MPLFKFLKKVIEEYSTDKGGQLAAAFAYTSVFAVVPFLIVIISFAGLAFGQEAVSGQLFSRLSEIVGPSAANTVQKAIAHTHQNGHGMLALIVGLVGSLLAATALTNRLQSSFDAVFAVVPDPKGGIKRMVYVKAKNGVLLIAGSLVIAASVAATAVLTAVGNNLAQHLGMPRFTLQLLNLLASLAVFVLILYLVYRVLPDVRLPKKIVFWTSLIVAVMFLLGKVVLGWVIGRNGTATAYGAAASLITLLLWFYYTGQILIFGAEGMKVYVHNRGIDYKPKPYTLRQKTINIWASNTFSARLADRFARGFTRKTREK